MNSYIKHEIAFNYLIGNLNTEEKAGFFKLVLDDVEFKTILSQEMKIFNEMQKFNLKMPMEMKNYIFKNIQEKTTNSYKCKSLVVSIANAVFNITLPQVVTRIINISERKVRINV